MNLQTIEINGSAFALLPVAPASAGAPAPEAPSAGAPHKYQPGTPVLVRSRDQGVMFGLYVSHSGREVTLRNARQVWQFSGGLCLPDIAVHGLAEGSRLSDTLPTETTMLEACGILPTTEKATASLTSWPADKAGR